MLRQLGMTTDAESVYQTFAAAGKVEWRSALQRPCSFSPALLGVPYPLEPAPDGAGLPMPPTIQTLLDNFPAIQAEFEQLFAPRGEDRPDVGDAQEDGHGQDQLNAAGHSANAQGAQGRGEPHEQVQEQQRRGSAFDEKAISGPRLVEGRDPNVWHALAFCSHGVWNEANCALMPSICNLLRGDPQVSGRIPLEKVEALNKEGGWLPANPDSSWIQAEHRGENKKHYLDETTFMMSRGHVPDLEVAVLRLAPGGRLVPHVGSSNARINMHIGLRIPEAHVGIRVGEGVRQWEVGKAIVFDESFEHEVWNTNADPTAYRYVLQMHMWHPALAELVEHVGSTKWQSGSAAASWADIVQSLPKHASGGGGGDRSGNRGGGNDRAHDGSGDAGGNLPRELKFDRYKDCPTINAAKLSPERFFIEHVQANVATVIEGMDSLASEWREAIGSLLATAPPDAVADVAFSFDKRLNHYYPAESEWVMNALTNLTERSRGSLLKGPESASA